MATWGSLRVPDFKEDLRLSRQPALTADSPLSRPPPLESMRPVKRNPFSASFLKSKTTTKPTTNNASNRFCGVHLSDLTRRARGLISSRISSLNSFGTLSRSRSERKQDWELVKFLLKDGNPIPPSEKLKELREVIEFPMLESLLLRDNCQLKLSLHELPVMLLISPPKKISMLRVESNLYFEVEYLKSLCENICSPHTQNHANERSHFANILKTLEEGATKKLIDPHSQVMRLERPVVKLAAIRSSAMGRLNIDTLESVLFPTLDTTDTALKAFRANGVTNQERSMAEFRDMEKYKGSVLEVVIKVAGSFKTSTTNEIVAENFWSQRTIYDHALKADDEKEPYYSAEGIGRPIFLRKILSSNDDVREENVTREVPIPDARPARLCTNLLFQWLSAFQRSIFTSEQSLWNRASKEVLSRAKYKRQRILSSHLRNVSLIILSGLCSARITIASNLGSICEPLDSLVFSHLRVISAAQHEKKHRTTELLDKLDFVPENVAKSRQRFLTKCYQRVMKMQHKYDSPVRKWGQVDSENILSRYEGTKAYSEELKESLVCKNGHLEHDNVDSDESALDDLILSDEDLDGEIAQENALGILEEIRADLRHHGHWKSGSQLRSAEGEHKKNGDLRDLSAGTRKKVKLRLKVPDTLVCSPWVIQVAEQCINTMPRGSIFLPPPLSVLPIIAILTSTHLRDSVRDQRVVIVCESQTEVNDYIREYLQSSLGHSISVDSIRRSECGGVESIVPLPRTTARVVLLDSFFFSFSATFSLLIVFVSGEKVSPERIRLRDQVFIVDGSQWVRIPFVLVVPLHEWVGLQAYSTAARHISTGLRIKDVIWVKAKDDVRDSIEISVPRTVHLAPPQQATHATTLLDAQAAPYLQTYRSLNRKQLAQSTTNLQDVSHRLVRETLQETLDGDIRGQCQLELLYTFRQARTFVIYDGFDIAVAYLEHCSKQSKGQVRRAVTNILKDLECQRVACTSSTHPVVKVLRKCVNEAEKGMLRDAPSLRSIHRRDRFRPLIVANSQETVNGCLQDLKDAALLSEATNRSIAICSLHEINTGSTKKPRDVLRRKLEEFSHVFHITDDRYDVPSSLLLPPALLQHVHAGRTRLMIIAVDETRELDERWEREVSWYDELSRGLDKEGFGDIEYGAPYLQQLSVETFWSVAKNTFSDWEDLVKRSVRRREPHSGNLGLNRENGTVRQHPATLYLSTRDVCSATVDGLRKMLNEHLERLPRECPVFRVFIYVGRNERCSPAVTYVHSALAGSASLQKRITVKTLFTF